MKREMIDDLKKRLRASRVVWEGGKSYPTEAETAAADCIEELVEERDTARRLLGAATQMQKETEAKLTKAVAFIRRHIPDSVYEQRQRANAFLAELDGK